MKNVTTINGYYGSNNTPCKVFIYENRNSSKWYCVEGSQMVNKTFDEIPEGTNIEELRDHDCFTSSSEINNTDEFISAIED